MANEPLSRNEEILKSILSKTEYNGIPQSRIEKLLIDLKDMIDGGGATPEEIQAAINSYLDKHPEMVEGVDEELLKNALKGVFG